MNKTIRNQALVIGALTIRDMAQGKDIPVMTPAEMVVTGLRNLLIMGIVYAVVFVSTLGLIMLAITMTQ